MTVTFRSRITDVAIGSVVLLLRTPLGWLLLGALNVLTLPATLRSVSGLGSGVTPVVTVIILQGFLTTAALVLSALIAVAVALMSRRGVLTDHTITFDDESLTETTDVNTGVHHWTGISRVVRWGGVILVVVSPGMAHIIPRRAVESREQWDSLYIALARAHRGARA